MFHVDSVDGSTAFVAHELAAAYPNITGLIPSNYSIKQLASCVKTIFAGIHFWPEEMMMRIATGASKSTRQSKDNYATTNHFSGKQLGGVHENAQSPASHPPQPDSRGKHKNAATDGVLPGEQPGLSYAYDQSHHRPSIEDNDPNKVSLDCLTPRQREVLSYLAIGKSNKYIAAELGVCESTIKVHVSEIMRRLRATSRTHASYIFNSIG